MPIRLYQRSPIPAGKDVSVLVLDANSYFSIFLIVGALVLGLFYWGYVRSKDQWETVSPLKNPRKSNRSILFLLLGALVIKLCFAALVMKPHFDYQYFFRWSNEVYQYGFDVYQQSSFLDYPPGYLYILYAIRWLAGLFQLDLTGPVYRTMMETPVILGELLGGWVLYQVARKYRPGNRFWLYFAPTIYLFNPASFLNVNFWGQVDALLASLMMLSFYLVGQNKWIAGALAFTGAVLLKPQALMMTPVYLYFILDCGIASIRERDARPIGRAVLALGSAFVVFVLVCLPFSAGRGPLWMLDLYFNTMVSYSSASLGACNLFGLFDGSGTSVYNPFFFLTFSDWSSIFTVLCILAAGVVYFMSKREHRLLLSALWLYTSLYTLTAFMHERYLFPTLIMVLSLFLMNKDRFYLRLYVGFSIVNYACTAMALSAYYAGGSFDHTAPMYVFSFVMVAAFVLFTRHVILSCRRERKSISPPPLPVEDGSGN